MVFIAAFRLSLIVVCRFLPSVTSLVEEHTLYLLALQQLQLKNSRTWTSVVVVHMLSCPHGEWNLPPPGMRIFNHWTTREVLGTLFKKERVWASRDNKLRRNY